MCSPYGSGLAGPHRPTIRAVPPADAFDAILFDLDGVLTPTADIHQRAWTTMFDEFLVPRGDAPFTDDDYLQYVDGRPRFDGVRTFLQSRGITLPEGEPDRSARPGIGERARQPQERRLLGDPAA